MSTPSFKYGNGVWATKEGSSLAYNDDNGHYKPLPFSVSRASSATRVNKQGLIEVVGNDRLRIDYSESTKGVALLEPSRTNLITYSEAISNAPIKSGANFDDNSAISPDGTQNATKLTALNTDPYFYQNGISFSAADYTASIWVKGIGNSIGKEFRIVLGGFSTSPKLVIPSEWTRFEFTATMPSGSASAGLEIPDPPIVGDEVLVWGWQVEQGSYATSYIPTSGSTATRQADVANGAGVANVFNDSEGVLFLNLDFGETHPNSRYISLNDTSNNNRIQIGRGGGFDSLSYFVSVGGSTQVGVVLSEGIGQILQLAIRYKANDYSIYSNGFEIYSNTSLASTPIGLRNLEFSTASGGEFYGKAKAINVYQTALTDAELEYLTSYRSLAEMVTELNLNAL